jgi:hypothetical protein
VLLSNAGQVAVIVLAPVEVIYTVKVPVPPVTVFEVAPERLDVDSVKVITHDPVKALVSSPFKTAVKVKSKFILGVVVVLDKVIVWT